MQIVSFRFHFTQMFNNNDENETQQLVTNT